MENGTRQKLRCLLATKTTLTIQQHSTHCSVIIIHNIQYRSFARYISLWIEFVDSYLCSTRSNCVHTLSIPKVKQTKNVLYESQKISLKKRHREAREAKNKEEKKEISTTTVHSKRTKSRHKQPQESCGTKQRDWSTSAKKRKKYKLTKNKNKNKTTTANSIAATTKKNSIKWLQLL